ncbi:MAG: SpoIID/LytB domain-containing protein [Planctomycetes bacterium]|nr:SpoIID/LytB domain-containing protein [Planctomycetota bacterium]
MSAIAVLALLIVSTPGCTREPAPVEAPLGVRPVRVLLFESGDGCELCVDAPFSLTTADGETIDSGEALECARVTVNEGIRIGDLQTEEESVTLLVEGYGKTTIARFRKGEKQTARSYAGEIEFSVRDDGVLRVVNRVDIESYISGVVPREASSAFGDESLKGQAIAARTYAMYIMAQRADRSYDLRASEGAQVYGGIATGSFGRRASEAVEATRGLVLSHSTPDGPRVFCAYYSSACGGRSQSLSDVQQSKTPEPLRGGVQCDFCSIAPKNIYRWGPNEITKSKLLSRLQNRRKAFEGWTSIGDIRVVKRTSFGRVQTVSVQSKKGEEILMRAEPFRLAVGSRTMRSTHCQILDSGASIRLTDGQGFGHGLGLCQWGMEGLARQGRQAGEILRFYYPGSRIVRAY